MNKPLLIALAALLAGNVQAQNNPSYKVEVCFEDTQAGGKYVFRSSDLTDNFSDTLTLKKDGEKVVFKKEYTEPFTLTLSYIAPGEQRAGIAGNAFFIDGPLTIRIAGTQAAMLPAASVEGGVQDDPILQQIQPINAAMYTAFLDYQKLRAHSGRLQSGSRFARGRTEPVDPSDAGTPAAVHRRPSAKHLFGRPALRDAA